MIFMMSLLREETKMKILIYFSIIILAIITNTLAQDQIKLVKELNSTAIASLETYKLLISEDNYKEMGFESLNDIYTATLDTPIVDYFIRLDQLKKYDANNKLEDLLIPTEQFYYPVLVKGQVRSSITVSKIDGKWQAVSFGSHNFIELVANALKENKKESKLSSLEYFIVRIPSLNKDFLGYKLKGEILLVPLSDDSSVGFKSGVSLPASKVILQILPEAKAHDDLPR
jgi:hypothetical protein